MKKYNRYILIAILLGIIGLTYWMLGDKESTNQTTFSEPQLNMPFSSQPDSIALVYQNEVNFLTLKNQYLYFNGEYRVKPELQEAFIAILKQVEVRRPVSKKQQTSLSTAIDTAGVEVNVYESGLLVKSFELWGDERRRVTYIKETDKDDIYIATIPGHSVYLAEIFYYKENQWRSNTLFNSTWRSLKKLEVHFPKAPSGSFSVQFSEDFFYIPELEAVDTIALLDYLETFSSIRVAKYLPAKENIADSMAGKEPDLRIKIDDFDALNSDLLQFYLQDSTVSSDEVLVTQQGGDVGVISLENFRKIAKEKQHFAYREQKD